ncbi:unnamed protein product [Parnassius mnemosyne]|uniref:Uncharacterized protein n=1 Tax=Parnassius mnemosyne TaxID=213953 RepID=A0AAV1LDY6_9NEOP
MDSDEEGLIALLLIKRRRRRRRNRSYWIHPILTNVHKCNEHFDNLLKPSKKVFQTFSFKYRYVLGTTCSIICWIKAPRHQHAEKHRTCGKTSYHIKVSRNWMLV